VLRAVSITLVALFYFLGYLGLTSLHATDFPGRTIDLNLDNVSFSQTPEPATIILLTLGGSALIKKR
jgi:hypothetical protein